MKAKSVFALFLAALFVAVFCCSAFATTEDPTKWRDEKSHNRWTQAMIFGNPAFTSYKDEKIQQKVEILEEGLLLCIDQFKSSYTNELEHLNSIGVPSLPSSITAIDFQEWGPKHRAYTHRGWNHKYTDLEEEKSHPTIRREILRNSVEYVFSFKKYYSSIEQSEKTRDALCCLLYVTHIIGDRFHSTTYYGAISTLLLADDSNAETVISDLLECLPVLFPNQKGINEYKTIVRQLNKYSDELIRRHRQNPKIEDLQEIDSEYAEKIKDLLKDNLPNLLKQQNWFTNAFPLSCWNGA